MGEFDETAELEASPLEYVIHLGTQGNHILFDNDRIRQAFLKGRDKLHGLDEEMLSEVRQAISQVVALPEVEAQKDYISKLSPAVQDVLIHLYFQMIEKTLLINRGRPH